MYSIALGPRSIKWKMLSLSGLSGLSTLDADILKKLEAEEIWVLRKTLRTSYMEHVTNEEVLRSAIINRKPRNEIVNNLFVFVLDKACEIIN